MTAQCKTSRCSTQQAVGSQADQDDGCPGCLAHGWMVPALLHDLLAISQDSEFTLSTIFRS